MILKSYIIINDLLKYGLNENVYQIHPKQIWCFCTSESQDSHIIHPSTTHLSTYFPLLLKYILILLGVGTRSHASFFFIIHYLSQCLLNDRCLKMAVELNAFHLKRIKTGKKSHDSKRWKSVNTSKPGAHTVRRWEGRKQPCLHPCLRCPGTLHTSLHFVFMAGIMIPILSSKSTEASQQNQHVQPASTDCTDRQDLPGPCHQFTPISYHPRQKMVQGKAKMRVCTGCTPSRSGVICPCSL